MLTVNVEANDERREPPGAEAQAQRRRTCLTKGEGVTREEVTAPESHKSWQWTSDVVYSYVAGDVRVEIGKRERG